MVVLGLLATLVVICAVGGVLIGYSSDFGAGSSGKPAPVVHTTPTHPASPSKSPGHSPSARPKPTRPKPSTSSGHR